MKISALIIAVFPAIVCSSAFAASVGLSATGRGGGDPEGRHYSDANQITPDNVSRLKPAWIYRTGDLAGEPEASGKKSSGQATPLMLPPEAGEHLVTCTPYSRVVALDPANGVPRWEYDPQVRRGGSRVYRCRGVSYWQSPAAEGSACRHRLFVSTHDRRLIALDARDGRPCADFGANGIVQLPDYATVPPGDVSGSSAPAVANGVVVVGSAIVDFEQSKAPRGTVYAFDAMTGARRWAFDPLEGLEETGAANVWAQISIDAGRDLVFLATSSPSPDYYGVKRPGRNGHANSVVALQLSSGKTVWSFATSYHDLWDYDLPAQPLLFDWPGPAGPVPALVQLTKQGLAFVLDRRSGAPLFGVEERPVAPSTVAGEVAAPTQPFPLKPPPLVNSRLTADDAWGLSFWDRGKCRDQIAQLENHGLYTPPSEQRFLMLPGSLGGANWGGGAYLAAENLLIVNVNTAPFHGQLIRTETLPAPSAGDHIKAGSAFVVRMQGTPYTMKIDALKSPLGIPCVAPPWGKLVAVDLASGEIRWQAPLGSIHEMGPFPLPFRIDWGTPNLGGGMVTGTGVYFIGAAMDRLFRAFDARSGKELWSYQLPVDATAIPMSYTYQGRQYVVVNAGGHNMYNRGLGDYFYAFMLL